MDGQDIAGISLHSFRQAVGYVTQESVMYSGTIRQNLLYGLDRTPDDRELDRVCEAVGILDFVQEQPEGYDTPVGEAGASLSGGQRQRFSVARALLQKSDILLLDEATAAMDIAGKDCVWKSIRTLMAARRWCMWPTTPRRCKTPTGSWCWNTGRSPRRAIARRFCSKARSAVK